MKKLRLIVRRGFHDVPTVLCEVEEGAAFALGEFFYHGAGRTVWNAERVAVCYAVDARQWTEATECVWVKVAENEGCAVKCSRTMNASHTDSAGVGDVVGRREGRRVWVCTQRLESERVVWWGAVWIDRGRVDYSPAGAANHVVPKNRRHFFDQNRAAPILHKSTFLLQGAPPAQLNLSPCEKARNKPDASIEKPSQTFKCSVGINDVPDCVKMNIFNFAAPEDKSQQKKQAVDKPLGSKGCCAHKVETEGVLASGVARGQASLENVGREENDAQGQHAE